MTFHPSKAQRDFFKWVEAERGNAILEAVAGAGKTTTILHAIQKMSGRVWFGVYNKKMADEIKAKVAERGADGAPRFPALVERGRELETSTFHSLGMQIWMWNNKGSSIKVDDKKMLKIVESLVLEREGADQQRRDDLREVAGMVCGIVSMAKNRGIGMLSDIADEKAWLDMIEHFDLDSRLPEGVHMPMVLKFSCVALQRSIKQATSVIDFDDMIYMPLDSKVKTWTYDWVLIDEAQDTNPARRALARKILKKGGRLVAVGDPHQAIFGFTGADNDSLDQIKLHFKATSLLLNVTYRCPKAVVKHAQQWVSHILAHESAPEGEVIEQPYQEMLEALPTIGRAAYGETAILCRYNKHLVGLCFKMIRMGLPARIEGRAIGENLIKLTSRWKTIKTLNALESKLTVYRDREVTSALAKQQEDKADRITDEVETLLVLIERAREKGFCRVLELEMLIGDIFADNVAGSGQITLCSAHKSKGLEWDTVYLLDRKQFMPSKFAKQDWQIAQENNLIYVAVTRAKRRLIEVTGVVAEKEGTK